jgi:hypothetical protein
MILKHWQPALLAPALLLRAPGVFAQDAHAADSFSVQCISLTRVTRTQILDDQTILFYMRGQKTYSNHLRRDCPGLDEKARFAYQTTNGRLCNNDMITLLERGSGLNAGITCRLGEFLPAAVEEVLDLTRDENRRGARRNAIEVRRVELPPIADPGPAAAPVPSPTESPPPAHDAATLEPPHGPEMRSRRDRTHRP